MSSRGVSPGGALLRASRVFSIPPPLPRPMGNLSSQAIFNSDTATLPHPIHQSITTPQSSLARGDWGFKRPLPLRSTTKTSTPLIRVEAIDTFEHITEFNSSADHSITLQKWQEMGVPLSTAMPDVNRGGFQAGEFRSVFEADLDSISGSEENTPGREDKRWKFKGPWLAGQTEGDFNAFLTSEIRKRKPEFQKYLKTACAKSLTAEARRAAEGVEEAENAPMVEESAITEAQFTEFVKELRNTRAELYRLIRDFLDLPPAPGKSGNFIETALQSGDINKVDDIHLPISASPYAATGPPKTHPSAGLAYSITNAHTYNHPVWGPQKNPPPVSARVVMPKGAATGQFGAALGVGGFVTDLPAGQNSFNLGSSRLNRTKTRDLPGTLHVDPTKVGGSKMWVHPRNARVDPKGRIILTVEAGDPESVAVHEGTTDKIPMVATPKLRSRTFSTGVSPTFDGLGSRKNGGRGYGLNVGGRASRQDPPKRETPGQQDDPLSQLTGLV
ncbi:mitochondrial ribosomal protein MRP51 [Rhexocercosporidium sp. MPI-PUGE-AT-0058]|nr:mitochondrial ribosomal protein MRP51 [Rhexocercosporidium sp. MPI-PUGE-AT-0058]